MNLSEALNELQTFQKLVFEMRKKQKDFFRSRHSADLSQAKHYEKQVDKELEKLNPKTQNTQKKLL